MSHFLLILICFWLPGMVAVVTYEFRELLAEWQERRRANG
jgi:hypothetical protein